MNKAKKITSIILAAGYGTRLRPLTDILPKPLIPVGNRSLLENILVNCYNAGIAEFAVNSHHHASMIEDGITESFWKDKVTVLYEQDILGTGGPVVNAKDILLSGDAFLLHNGDILTNIDISELIEKHMENRSAAVTMVLIDGPENKVEVDEKGTVTDILGKLGRGEDGKLLTYAGIACFSPEIFNYLPEKPVNCSIITAVLEMMRENPEAVVSYQPSKKKAFFWNDLGTVQKFISVHKNIESSDYLLPELLSQEKITMPMVPLKRQGSGRVFFRLKGDNNKTHIAMFSSDDNEDFERFVDIGKFLYSQNLGTPQIFNVNMGNHTVIMEDLGDDSLYSLVQKSSEDEIESIYKKVIEWLVRFQIETKNENIPELRPFDFAYLRWETDYFKKNFLMAYCKLDESLLKALDFEFERLAEECLSHPQVMIHRDFQSQNIIINEGKVRIVDFQGARIGHIAYDLMSLVNDPYVMLPEELRNSLISYYFRILKNKDIRINIDNSILVNRAALQRNMQALGAYAFLSMKKNKKEYESFIPGGVKLLRETVKKSDGRFPALQRIFADFI